jgi:hypothetical protein
MKTLNRITSLFALLAVGAFIAAAQSLVPATSPYTITTVTAAIPNATNSGGNAQTQIPLASVTNVLAPGVNQAQGGLGSPTGGPNETGLLIDRELMRVNSVTGLIARVERGVQGTQTASHLTGTTVYVAGFGQFVQRQYFGSCTPSEHPTLPLINTDTGAIYNCPSVGPNADLWVIQGYLGPPGSSSPTNPDSSFFGNVGAGVLHFEYNFANDGGAIGTIIPKNNGTIPANSIITGCLIDATTAGTTSASGALSIGVSGTGGGTAILLAATAAASVTGVLQCVILPQTASGFKKITTAGTGEVAVATGALTAGVVEVYVYYETSPT